MLKWTSDKPTAPGWYWWRHVNGFVEVCQVTMENDHRRGRGGQEKSAFVSAEMDWEEWADECDGQWAGPIPEPGEFTEPPPPSPTDRI